MSICPKQCELIVNGRKTIDVRKTKPKLDTPFKCYIYCTQSELLTKSHHDGKIYVAFNKKHQNALERSGNITLSGKVIGEFICDYILQFTKDDHYSPYDISDDDLIETCLSQEDLYEYGKGKTLYGWHVSKLMIYNEPKELNEFMKINRKCWYATLGIVKRDCSECKYESCFINKPPQSWCYVEGTTYCKNCKYLMFSDFYAECGKGYKGILNFDDFCDKGELR